jgi:hypothetical protein
MSASRSRDQRHRTELSIWRDTQWEPLVVCVPSQPNESPCYLTGRIPTALKRTAFWRVPLNLDPFVFSVRRYHCVILISTARSAYRIDDLYSPWLAWLDRYSCTPAVPSYLGPAKMIILGCTFDTTRLFSTAAGGPLLTPEHAGR